MFKPSAPFTVAMKLLVPVSSSDYGAKKKVFSTPSQSATIFGSFRTFGGTETTENGLLTTVNTGVINTWFRPDIKADCRIYLCDTKDTYEIISDPEDIDFRHQYLQFKVKKVGGKA